MDNIEKNIGYNFKNRKWLKQALTHSSYSTNVHCNYERLEFLGDRLLGVIIAEMLCQTFKDEPEGNLAQRFAYLVSKDRVAEVVVKLGINEHIIVNRAEVRESINVLCDVGEAIIASIYMDSGSLDEVKKFVYKNWNSLLDESSKPRRDFKTVLQEEIHPLGYNAPQYNLIEKSGSEHDPLFLVEVNIGKGKTAKGEGHNKKQAEQQAAQRMLEILGIKND